MYDDKHAYEDGIILKIKKKSLLEAVNIIQEHDKKGYHLSSLVFVLHKLSIDIVDATKDHIIICPIKDKRALNLTVENVEVERLYETTS